MQNPQSWIQGSQLHAHVSRDPRRLLIGGSWVPAIGGESIEVIDPSRRAEVAWIARGGAADVDLAVEAARTAFAAWRNCHWQKRADLMVRLAALMEANADELAMLEAIDGGKPVASAKQIDVLKSAARLRYTAEWAGRCAGRTIEPGFEGPYHIYTVREPVGTVGLIVPWNFPLGTAITKIAPALAAGCTIVLKPAELTSLATLRLGELVVEAGFPAGVVNIVTGYGAEAGQALADHPKVDKISFTGSTAIGKSLVRAAAGNLKRLTLELGGKSPAIVFKDADFDLAVRSVLQNFTFNSGQICVAGARVYVEKEIYPRFLEALGEKAKAIRVGPAVEAGTQMGPLISERQLERVAGYVEGAASEGAKVVVGGGHGGDGYYFEPTIITDTNPMMAVRREEIFGPVATVIPFDDDLEALAAEANDTDYGLSAYVYTRDLSRAHRMASMIQAGMIRVNGALLDYTMPFGGFKQSGWGRENGEEGVLAFTELKTVAIAL